MSISVQLMDQIIDQFDFNTVHAIMVIQKWKWSNPDGSEEIPSISRMKDCVRELGSLLDPDDVGDTDTVSTGGFWLSNNWGRLRLQFVLEESSISLGNDNIPF